jgi:phytoene dehydrogenase-like protein
LNACVIGAGPNGLAAAIVLAQAGMRVEVIEAQATPGGAARTLELTLPGFRHDFGSAVYPLAVGSPFFSALPLAAHGLQWIHSPVAVAHPLDDGSAVTIGRGIKHGADALGVDRAAWNDLIADFATHWDAFAPDVLHPLPFVPRNPLRMARFGALALQSARSVAHRFRSERTRALFAGMAAHSFLRLDEPLSAAFGLLMAVSACAVGWPIPRGGAQSITTALCGVLASLGGTVRMSSPVTNLADLAGYDVLLCDVTPRQLAELGEARFSKSYLRQLRSYRYGVGVFKVDYALRSPIPWQAAECSQAATVHVGGTFDEIAASEAAVRGGQHAERPFVLLAQPSLFDDSRAPAGQHTAWAYCHVPNGSTQSALASLENQIERFAPGFRDCILARHTLGPHDLERMDANLVGGDIGGGAMDLRQFLFRPTWRGYATSASDTYLCSASTPPGAGVHGMCGYHAATKVLADMKGSSRNA